MMAEVIEITNRLHPRNNLVTAHPLEFRSGDWQTGYAMLCTREESQRYEAHRIEAFRSPGHQHIGFVPNHFRLDGGYHFTVMGLFRHRMNEALMRRAYRLAGLMECVTNAPSPILRTDLLRRFYKTILEERQELNLVWRGDIRHFLLPLHSSHRNSNLFLHHIAGAQSLKELFEVIEEETNAQFDILSASYVFYLPENLIPHAPHGKGT